LSRRSSPYTAHAILPLLNLRLPEITRSLLRYRYRRLDASRAAAQAAGLRGAMYPWQSGSNGREESQSVHLNPRSGQWTPDETQLQRHVGSAVAFNIWRYYESTGDYEFLAAYGAEMLLEIARFRSSMAARAPESDVADIQGGTTSEGIHLGAMAGTVDLIQRCYTGIEIRDGHLWLNPILPREV